MRSSLVPLGEPRAFGLILIMLLLELELEGADARAKAKIKAKGEGVAATVATVATRLQRAEPRRLPQHSR